MKTIMTTPTTKKTTTRKSRTLKAKSPLPDPRKTTKVVENLPTNPFIFEILDLATKQKSNAKKVQVLTTYEHDALKSVLKWNFDPGIISLLPPGEVPYAEPEEQTAYAGTLSENLRREAAGGGSATGQDLDGRGRTSLRRERKNLYHYVRGGNDKLPKARREMMFINLLRGLHPREAELLCLVKDKDLESQYDISWANVKQAFPNMTWSA